MFGEQKSQKLPSDRGTQEQPLKSKEYYDLCQQQMEADGAAHYKGYVDFSDREGRDKTTYYYDVTRRDDNEIKDQHSKCLRSERVRVGVFFTVGNHPSKAEHLAPKDPRHYLNVAIGAGGAKITFNLSHNLTSAERGTLVKQVYSVVDQAVNRVGGPASDEAVDLDKLIPEIREEVERISSTFGTKTTGGNERFILSVKKG